MRFVMFTLVLYASHSVIVRYRDGTIVCQMLRVRLDMCQGG